jgi:3-phosphoshikimate 1-carboxyvinyltransferase
MDHLDLAPVARMAGTIRLPGSKSISNRTLLLAALARGRTELEGILDAEDVDRMLRALRALGVGIEQRGPSGELAVEGLGGEFPVKRAALSLGNAGTAFRPLTAVLALVGGDYELSGSARMHERPIGDLVDALRSLGAQVRYLGREGYPPLAISRGAIRGSNISVSGEVSSQFTSALLMALPLLERGTTLSIVGELISKPYVEMTLALMDRFGVRAERQRWERIVIPRGASYASPGRISVEGDASSASYFLAAGAIGGGPLRVEGVGSRSIQGDVGFAATLEQMGAVVTRSADAIEVRSGAALRAIDADFNSMPDAAMTAAVVALFAKGTSTLRNIGSWRVKETDRIGAMAAELRKLGATVAEGADWIAITPPEHLHAATIDTYDDHRMAMCFSLAALGGVAVRINDPGCVRKTFPGYFAEFKRLAVPPAGGSQ